MDRRAVPALVLGALFLLAAAPAWAAPPLVGPYLLGVEPTRITVAWEDDGKVPGVVIFREPEGEARRVGGKAVAMGKGGPELKAQVYKAVLADLKPCQRYEYRVEPFEEGYPRSFRTAPNPGELCPGGLRIAVFGDTRYHDDRHARVVDRMGRHEPQVALNVGDIVTDSRQLKEWRAFFQVEREFIDRTPMVLALGNHEGWPDQATGLAISSRYFGTYGGPAHGHYRFDYGPVRVLVLDPWFGTPMGGEGAKWLERELEAVPAGRIVFLLVHNPLYSFGPHGAYEDMVDLRPLVKKHRVTAVFSGHVHHYEHFLADGTHFLTLGGGGAPFHEPNEKVIPEERHLQLDYGKFLHFLLVDVSAEEIRFRVYDVEGDRLREEWGVGRGKDE